MISCWTNENLQILVKSDFLVFGGETSKRVFVN